MNYQTYGTRGFQLRLRLYKDGETRFINVNKLLKGSLVKRHWNIKKKCFYSSAPFSEENNRALVSFMAKYEEMAREWNGSLGNFMLSIEKKAERCMDDRMTLKGAFEFFIEEMKSGAKNPDGTLSGGYENYEKTHKRLDEFCRENGGDYESLALEDVNYQFVNNFLEWVGRNGCKCIYASASLRAVLNKSAKRGWYDRKDMELCRWIKKTDRCIRKYESLTDAQVKKFISLTRKEMPRNRYSELYRDFCTFIIYTCQSPCDAISLKYSNIKVIGGEEHFVFKRRKLVGKQKRECTVPINSVMKDIMGRWKSESKDGYIFPIRSKKRIAENKVNNGDIKHFIGRLNSWLRKISPLIDCQFPLHSYVFRHTGITHYVSSGAPIVYIANLAGTSVPNIEDIYYNNHGDMSSRNIVLNALF